ncbi:CAP domain-containing protein [Streptomyces exfoliatus]|uniref:CAP domain-containing protein n=1 Tax=Streptomyces exfoliatus TaxID=1905 RepID=UPI0004649FA9|nr:CAP domain-containing protein [Streptomyces exfoliatus]
MRQSTGIGRDTELVLAARNGDPWAREQLVTAHLPLIHTTVGLALSGRDGVEGVEHVVRETMLRALGGLATLTDPAVFRPWLVAIAVDGIRRHRHAQPAGFGYGATGTSTAEGPHPDGHAYEITEAARWLDPDDGELLALWRLECTGELTRYETAAALRCSVEDMGVRVEAVRARLDAARVLAGSLAGTPHCPSLSREAAGWDGRPSAPWRDHLAHHTLACAHCATHWNALVPAEILLTATPPAPPAREATQGGRATPQPVPVYSPDQHGAPAAYATSDPYGAPDASIGSYGTTDVTAQYDTVDSADMVETAEPYLLAGSPEPAAHPHIPRRAGRQGSRAALRRRRQTQERSRRRAVIAAGVVVMAVTGGAFSLYGGRGGDDEGLEASRLSAPGLDLPLAHDPVTHSGAPSETSASPSASPSTTKATTKSASAHPSTPASPSARTTTTAPTRPAGTSTPAKQKTTPPRTTAPTPGSGSTGPATDPNAGTGNGTNGGTGGGNSGGGSGNGTGSGTDAGPQNDQGQSSAADQVVALVNEERAKAGCGPLTANATLTSAAQGHSDDMAARDFFDHTNPDGAGPGERVTAAGYPWSTYGENIAMGQSTPEEVMDSWMNSPGHRANILNCDFKEIGIGIHSSGGPYWTQVFGAR